MQFMDWRDGHLSPDYKEMNNDHPTFLYAMPFTDRKIFFEVGLCKLNRMPDLSGLS
jgi:lycopene beta-cyclase